MINAFDAPDLITFVMREHPELFPPLSAQNLDKTVELPHGTTIVAIRFREGVILAGDRRTSMGYRIHSEMTEKVHAVDNFTAVGAAGLAMLCHDIPKVLRAEFSFKECVDDGEAYSFDGKVRIVARFLMARISMALSGLSCSPVLVGYDDKQERVRIVSFDSVGGANEFTEEGSYCVGSGGTDAKSVLHNAIRKNGLEMTLPQALTVVVEALETSSTFDMGTGMSRERNVWPLALVITKDGVRTAGIEEIQEALTRSGGQA